MGGMMGMFGMGGMGMGDQGLYRYPTEASPMPVPGNVWCCVFAVACAVCGSDAVAASCFVVPVRRSRRGAQCSIKSKVDMLDSLAEWKILHVLARHACSAVYPVEHSQAAGEGRRVVCSGTVRSCCTLSSLRV